jgi:hypothetical protein
MGIRLLAAVATLAAGCSLAAQTTWHVDPACGDDGWTGLSDVCAAPDGPKRTIQAAMAEAVSGDEVMLADGDYHQSLTTEPINFRGRDMVLRSRSGPENCTVHLHTRRPGVVLETGETRAATVHGITFLGIDEETTGGGMTVVGAAVTIVDCVFRSCARASGDSGFAGAIYGDRAAIAIRESSFIGNGRMIACATNSGGAIGVSRSELEIADCVFMGNHPQTISCAGASFSSGGAIYASDSAVTIERSLFAGNSASQGGAINSGTVNVSNCEFQGNTAFAATEYSSSGGGAIRAGTIIARDCVFLSNGASTHEEGSPAVGGAISATFAVVVQCSFAENRAWSPDCSAVGAAGGAVGASSLQATNCVFSMNSSSCGAGALSGSDLALRNCILWSSNPDHFTLSGGSRHLEYCDIQGGYPGEGNIDADPLFLDPAAGDLRLRGGSPCIDAGDSSAVPAGVTLDLAGAPRFRDDPRTPDTGKGPAPIVDMGAYEFQPSCYADCDGSGELTFFDFLCFQNAFSAGCS